MSDNIDLHLEEPDRKKSCSSCNKACNCSSYDITTITACLQELHDVANSVFEFLDCNPTSSQLQKMAICAVLNEIRAIEAKLDNDVFSLEEIKNEIKLIENEVTAINNTLNNGTSGIFEIKNEIRSIENELTVIGNNILALNHALSCENDSVKICGLGVDGVTRTVQQDTHGAVSTLPNASAYCQAGQLFCLTRTVQVSCGSCLDTAFENPPGNTKTMYLESISCGVDINQANMPRDYEETLAVAIFEGNITTGTIVTPVNRNFGSPIVSALAVSVNPVITTVSKTASSTRHPTGEVSLNFSGQIIVPPGHNVVIEVSPHFALTTTGILAITFTWFEV